MFNLKKKIARVVCSPAVGSVWCSEAWGWEPECLLQILFDINSQVFTFWSASQTKSAWSKRWHEIPCFVPYSPSEHPCPSREGEETGTHGLWARREVGCSPPGNEAHWSSCGGTDRVPCTLSVAELFMRKGGQGVWPLPRSLLSFCLQRSALGQ